MKNLILQLFWGGKRYHVETIGNITDEAVQKYIKEQAEESRKEDSRSNGYSDISFEQCLIFVFYA